MKKIFKITFTTYLILLTYLALTPIQIQGTQKIWDKGAHFIAYALLLIFMKLVWTKWSYFQLGSVCVGYSCLMEVVQYFIPSRSAELLDIWANFLGVMLGILLTLLLPKKNNFVQ